MRRIHTQTLRAGEIDLDPGQSHHIRDVLRMSEGEEIELFDDAGQTTVATIVEVAGASVTVRVERIVPARQVFELTLASALPKGERADWMIEKLSELGVARFVPLQTGRSVVHPAGHSKLARWKRIAAESAKQSHRPGVMQIDGLTALEPFVSFLPPLTLHLAPVATAPSLLSIVHPPQPMPGLTLIIGPEGGWADEELKLFRARNIPPVRLTSTILRIETAAITAAALVLCSFNPRPSQ